MALPQAIQQQVEQAENLQKQLYSQEPAVTEGDQTVAEPSADAEPQTAQVIEMPKGAEPAKVETPTVSADEDVSVWKQRFASLQGKFNAEVPALYQQLREQSQQIQKLTDMLTTKQQETPAAKEPDSLVTQKDREDFGEDLVDMVSRASADVVRKELAAAIAKMREEFGAVQAQVGQVAERVVKSEEEKFWDAVTAMVPDWADVDGNPEWREWLDTTPEFSEDSYRTIATKAIARGNPQKIAKLVELWRGPKAAPAPAPTAPAADLSRQVAPSTSRSAAAPQPTERIWTAQDYANAYDVRNVQRFGAEKAAQMIAEADRAVAEGRVRW